MLKQKILAVLLMSAIMTMGTSMVSLQSNAGKQNLMMAPATVHSLYKTGMLGSLPVNVYLQYDNVSGTILSVAVYDFNCNQYAVDSFSSATFIKKRNPSYTWYTANTIIISCGGSTITLSGDFTEAVPYC